MHKTDQLPKQMCSSCVYQLEKFYIFRKQCRKTDAKFRSFVRKVKSRKIQRLDELSDDDDDEEGDSGDTNHALVQEYEANQVLQQVNEQMGSVLSERIARSERELLQKVKKTLYQKIDNLVHEELAPKIDVVVKEKEKEKDKEPSIPPVRASPKRAVKRKAEGAVDVTIMMESVGGDGHLLLTDLDLSEQEEEEEEEPEEEEEQEPEPASQVQVGDAVVLKNGLIHACTECGRKFSTVEKLQKHAIDHEKERNVCGDCGKCFSSVGSLSRHQKIHSEEKAFKCDICGKGFTQKGSLQRHLLVHQADRPFACDDCDKAFSQKHLLTEHVTKAHSDNAVLYLFRCHECPKVRRGIVVGNWTRNGKVFCFIIYSQTFRYSSGLSRHTLSHTGKPFTCQICNKQLADYSSLLRHTKLVHKE